MVGTGRIVSLCTRHTFPLTVVLMLVVWVLDALVHSTGGAAEFVAHLVSTRAHDVAPRLFTAALIFSLVYLLRAEYLRAASAETVRRAAQEWSKTFDAMPDLVFTVDDDFRLTKANRALQARLGAEAQAIVGRRCYELLHGADAPPAFCPHVLARQDGQVHSVEISEPVLGGDFLLSVAPITDAAGRPAGVVHVARDVSERKRLQEQLEAAAYTDELTGLFNRRGFFTLAGKQMELARRRGGAAGLLYVDIDLMKEINDRWGHREGDRALQDAADVLRHTFRKADTIGRIGGDEFVVFFAELADAASQEAVLANLRRALAEHNEQNQRLYALELSGGIAFAGPGDTRSLEELFAQADRNMYLQKRASRTRTRGAGRGERLGLDLRRTPRVPLEGVVSDLVPGGRAALVDISAGGSCVGTPMPPEVGSVRDLRLEDGEGGLPLQVAVVWTVTHGPGVPVEVRCSSGLRFVEPL